MKCFMVLIQKRLLEMIGLISMLDSGRISDFFIWSRTYSLCFNERQRIGQPNSSPVGSDLFFG